jgi:signal transduction histidine kinase
MKFPSSVRARLIFIISGTITALLIVLFMAIVTLARSTLINNEIRNIRSIARTFSVFVLDTIISEGSQKHEKEFILESYILDFIKKEPYLKSILLYDAEERLVATSDFSYFSKSPPEFINFPVTSFAVSFQSQARQVRTINCLYPLQTGQKNWGTLVMGFDATPLMNEIKALFFILTVVAIVLVTVLQLLLYVMISRLTRSLTLLSNVVGQLDFETSKSIILKQSEDEVGILSRAISQLQQRLQSSRNEMLEVQKQVHHAEKLASVGRLAAGVAHEINNPLQGIKNCIQTISNEPDDQQQTENYLKLACEGLENIEIIVRKLLGYARKKTSVIQKVDLAEEMGKVLSLLDYKISSKSIKVSNLLQSCRPTIQGDPTQIQEVFMNLIINAIDALEDKGNIEISYEMDGGLVSIFIKDDGTGIAEPVINKIFDPFFTTKEQEMGTGLGLSVSLGIVESHGGRIQVESEAESGTTFIVTLPAGKKE